MLDPTVLGKLNLQLCKYVLGVSGKPTIDAVRVEIGRLIILVISMQRCLNYARRCYNRPCTNFVTRTLAPTLAKRQFTLEVDFSCLFTLPDTEQTASTRACTSWILNKYLPSTIQDLCNERYNAGWFARIDKSYQDEQQTSNLCLAKKEFGAENYVFGINRSERHYFSKLRTSSHYLEIETGSYTRPIMPREGRLWKSCSMGEVGDENTSFFCVPNLTEKESICSLNKWSWCCQSCMLLRC